jgi:ribosomal protein S18 acetylase RimI-like enzyme
MNKMKYREATKQDIPKSIELWKEFIDFHKDRDPFFSRSKEGPENFEKYVLENLSKEESIVYIAKSNGEVVGYIFAMIQDYPPAFEVKKFGFICDLAVASGYRRTGIGMHLVNIAKDWFVKKGMNRAEIGVAVTNEISTSFWEKMGFKPYKETCYLEL